MEKQNNQPLSFVKLALALANDYSTLYVINSENDSYVEYAPSGMEKNLLPVSEGDNFYEAVPHNCREQVWPEDQEHFLNAFKRENVMQALKDSMSFSIDYRLNINGVPRYFFLKTIRADENTIVIGVRDVDVQKRKELADAKRSREYSEIAKSLASMFEIIYHIDLETGNYTEYSSSEIFARQGFTIEGEDFFTRAKTDLKRVIHPDECQYVINELEKETLIANLRVAGSVSLKYRQLVDDEYQYMNLLAFIQKDDREHLIIGVRNVDAQVRSEQRIRAESDTFKDISTALAQRYEVIYHVNIITNEFTEYTASEKYKRLKIGVRGTNFFTETQINMRRDIYFEDLPMMSMQMKKENLMNSLSSFGKMILNYRLMLDGRPQYVSLYAVRPKEDSDHIIIAVANIDAAKRLEIAYQDMANKDALTGVKNKRAYVQAENELDELIQGADHSPFAIVVCDVNCLKQVNDTYGHKAGDDFIRNACFIICNIFKHSPVFRIGGDEFVVLLKGEDYAKRDELMNQLHKVLEDNVHNGISVLAAGMSEFDPVKDMRVQDVFERADSLMYTDKEICKAKMR